jgi:hypothetical protein
VYLLKTLKSKSAIFYIIISKKYTILKRSSESSGTSRTYTHLNQNTDEDFLRRSLDFMLQSSGSSGTQAGNRAYLDSTKFLFSWEPYFSGKFGGGEGGGLGGGNGGGAGGGEGGGAGKLFLR